MHRRRWLIHTVFSSLAHRRARSLLLLAVLALASGLVTSLGIVSLSMERRVAEEVRRFGANLLLLPETARMDVGSGGLSFGVVSEPAYLLQEEAERLVTRNSRLLAGHSSHLAGVLSFRGRAVPTEGVDFRQVRQLFPWWQVQGKWPGDGEALVGSDLAAAWRLRPGEPLLLSGPRGELELRVTGVVTTGGEEDRTVFIPLSLQQQALGLEGRLTLVRLFAHVGNGRLADVAATLQQGVRDGTIREVRQVARTSEELLRKVQLLMALVTAVVLVTSAGSVAGTMSATVLERGKEIGLMKAIGGRRRDVLLLFAAEALTLGILGGVTGYAAGNGIALLVIRSVFGAPMAFLPVFALLSTGAALAISLLGSLGPLIAVYRLEPVQSLRGE